MKGVREIKKLYHRSFLSSWNALIFVLIAYAAYAENLPNIIMWIMAILAGISEIIGIIFWVIWVRISFKTEGYYYVKKPESIYDID